jgi:hypothetical protein
MRFMDQMGELLGSLFGENRDSLEVITDSQRRIS